MASDLVCMNERVCVDDMLFVEVDRTDLAALRFNGVLGLSPGSTQVATSTTTKETNSYIELLYKDGTIDARIFSLHLDDKNNQSMFTLGGYD